MKTIRIETTDEIKQRKDHRNLVGIWPALAFTCLAWGILAPVLGLVFIIIHATVEGDTVFDEAGTVLMIVSIPLLLTGSHFLDVWDKRKKRTRTRDTKL